MSGKIFLDSNILIYAATAGGASPLKFARAQKIFGEENFGISTQVVGEFIRNVQNPIKMDPPLTDSEVDEWVSRLFEFPVIAIDREVVEHAILFQRRYQLAYWDGQILAAAHRLGAEILYSEDLSHGQTYGSVRCENPFRTH